MRTGEGLVFFPGVLRVGCAGYQKEYEILFAAHRGVLDGGGAEEWRFRSGPLYEGTGSSLRSWFVNPRLIDSRLVKLSGLRTGGTLDQGKAVVVGMKEVRCGRPDGLPR